MQGRERKFYKNVKRQTCFSISHATTPLAYAP